MSPYYWTGRHKVINFLTSKASKTQEKFKQKTCSLHVHVLFNYQECEN